MIRGIILKPWECTRCPKYIPIHKPMFFILCIEWYHQNKELFRKWDRIKYYYAVSMLVEWNPVLTDPDHDSLGLSYKLKEKKKGEAYVGVVPDAVLAEHEGGRLDWYQVGQLSPPLHHSSTPSQLQSPVLRLNHISNTTSTHIRENGGEWDNLV